MHFFDANNPTLVNRLLVREGKQKVYTRQAGTRLFVLLAGVGMFKWAATKHRSTCGCYSMASTSSTSRGGVRYHQYSDLVSYVVEHLGLHLKGKGDASCADESIACAFSRMLCCDDNRQVVLLCRLPLARAGLGFPTVTRSLKCRKCTIPDLTAIQPNFKAEEVQRHWIVRQQESDCTDVQNINMKFLLHLWSKNILELCSRIIGENKGPWIQV